MGVVVAVPLILNRTGGSRHEGKLRAAVENYTNLPVLGAIAADPELDISERHLGLTTPSDSDAPSAFVRGLGERIRQSVNLDALLGIAGRAPGLLPAPLREKPKPVGRPLRIGIARDEAFAFYYPDDLEIFAEAGAELVPVDLIRDPCLPDLDGLFVGGGYPEVHAAALSANATMLESVRTALVGGLPAYAECGGLMYLCRSLSWRGETHRMAGVFDADTVMHDRPQGRGYVRFSALPDALWPARSNEQRAHEFHFARLENLNSPVFARAVSRGHGIDGRHDALVAFNTQAGFIHLRHTAQSPWVTDFLEFIATRR